MSARKLLAELLRDGLPQATGEPVAEGSRAYRVVAQLGGPDQVDPGTFALRLWSGKVEPGPQIRSLQVDLVLWVLTGRTLDERTEDGLDDAMHDVVGVLLDSETFAFLDGERAVYEDGWQGWRLSVRAFLTWEPEPEPAAPAAAQNTVKATLTDTPSTGD